MKEFLISNSFLSGKLAQQDEHDKFHAHHMLGIVIGHTVVRGPVKRNVRLY